jgi:pyridoxal phosphate enzyme (YggS family)
MSIAQDFRRIEQRVATAARQSGRAASSVRLVAASKRQPVAAIREAYAAGCRHFGENYVQELVDKAAEMADLEGICWHHIGRLQRNKIKLVLPRVELVHGLDSLRLIEATEQRAGAAQRQCAALIQVNLGEEEAKSGCRPGDLGELLEAASHCEHIDLRGLMAIPPRGDQTESSFQQLAALRQAHGGAAVLPELSMGMSQDFERAIAAGATIVRVGSAIFGQRV